MSLCQSDNTEYTYTDDFMKIIKSIKLVEDASPETTPTDTAGAPDDWTNLLEKHYEEVKQQFEDAGFTMLPAWHMKSTLTRIMSLKEV